MAWAVPRIVVVLVLLTHLAACQGTAAASPPSSSAVVHHESGHGPVCDEQPQAPAVASPVRTVRTSAGSVEPSGSPSVGVLSLMAPRRPAATASEPGSHLTQGRQLLTALSIDRN